MKCVFPLFDSQRLNLQGPKQSSSSLLDCFFQINIFPKDLNPKQQPRLKSNTTQLLQVLGMVQSEVVYSIAKMFTPTLCLYMASTHINVAKAWKYLQLPIEEILFWRVWIVETTGIASQLHIFEQVRIIFVPQCQFHNMKRIKIINKIIVSHIFVIVIVLFHASTI